MISLCVLVRNIDITPLVRIFEKNCPCEWELCVGDNSSDRRISKILRDLSDEYIKITDKELFRGGLPEAHNRIAISLANTYKIFYLDSDEIPAWIHPNIENLFDLKYVITTLRYDFLTTNQILKIVSENHDFASLIRHPLLFNLDKSMQDRIYNCRYAKFNGLAHAIFHIPNELRSREIGCVILHNKTVRDKHERKEYTNPIIYEQYARQNRNPFLASSPVVLSWGKGKDHQYKDWKEFVEKCRR